MEFLFGIPGVRIFKVILSEYGHTIFDRGPPLGNNDHLSLFFDYACFSCPSPSEQGKRNMWEGDFEGMKRHLHLQNSNTMLVGDIETKWLTKTALLGLVE